MIQALGGKSPQLQHGVASAQTQTFTGIAYLLAALVVGGLLLHLRSRPSLGNTVER
jgi:MYXO-CTERM domain-containing protein